MNTLTEAQRARVLALLRAGKSLRSIERETGHRRETIAAYARRCGLMGGEPRSLDDVREPASRCEPYRAHIDEALDRGTSLRTLHAELVARHGFTASYGALKRFVRLHVVPRRTRDTAPCCAA